MRRSHSPDDLFGTHTLDRPRQLPDQRARTARWAQFNRGRGLVRRSTATSWLSTSNSASFDADERASSASHPSSRTKIRYSSHSDTAEDHAEPLSGASDAGHRLAPNYGTPQARRYRGRTDTPLRVSVNGLRLSGWWP